MLNILLIVVVVGIIIIVINTNIRDWNIASSRDRRVGSDGGRRHSSVLDERGKNDLEVIIPRRRESNMDYFGCIRSRSILWKHQFPILVVTTRDVEAIRKS